MLYKLPLLPRLVMPVVGGASVFEVGLALREGRGPKVSPDSVELEAKLERLGSDRELLLESVGRLRKELEVVCAGVEEEEALRAPEKAPN